MAFLNSFSDDYDGMISEKDHIKKDNFGVDTFEEASKKISDRIKRIDDEIRKESEARYEAISHSQQHYKQHKFEPIEIIEEYGMNFNLGNCIKYILRAEYKGSKKHDLEKALWYLQRELSKL